MVAYGGGVMSARLTGGTYEGGTEFVVECTLAWDRYDACQTDIEVTQRADGTWNLPDCCPGCGARIDENEGSGLRSALIDEATRALRNYEPSEQDVQDQRDAAYPTVGERQVAALGLK